MTYFRKRAHVHCGCLITVTDSNNLCCHLKLLPIKNTASRMHIYANRCMLTCANMLAHNTTTGIHTSMVQFSLQHSSHLQLGKLLSFVAGILCINELSEEELAELWALKVVNIEKRRQR